MNYQSMIKKLFFVFLCTCSVLHSHVVIWDVNGVLMQYNTRKLFSAYSFKDTLKGYFSAAAQFFKHPLSMKEVYFNTLNQLPYKSATNYTVYSEDGITPLPPLLKDLMIGSITYEQAKRVWYSTEKPDFLNKVFEFNFDPERFVNAQTIRTETVKLLQQCAEQVDKKGDKKNVCILLSNCGWEIVPFLKEKFADEISKYVDFEHSIFSGCVGCAKPDRSIFEILEQKINELPKKVQGKIFFFDDQKVNCDAGHECNKNMICAHPDDAPSILADHGIISNN